MRMSVDEDDSFVPVQNFLNALVLMQIWNAFIPVGIMLEQRRMAQDDMPGSCCRCQVFFQPVDLRSSREKESASFRHALEADDIQISELHSTGAVVGQIIDHTALSLGYGQQMLLKACVILAAVSSPGQ